MLRNFRYRYVQELRFLENVRYVTLLDSILELDDEFYKFPDSAVPSLQTLCIKCVMRRSSVFFEPYRSCSAEELCRALPPGPFDGLPPPLCDLLCDLLMSLRKPDSAVTPLYCVLSPYTRRLSLTDPLTEVAAAALAPLLAARLRHLVELSWTGAPLTRGLLHYLGDLPALTTLITDEPVDPADVRTLLQRCPALSALGLGDRGCVAALAELGVVGPQLRELRLVEDGDVCLDPAAVFAVFPGLEKLCVQSSSAECPRWRMREVDPETSSRVDGLKELSLVGCEECGVLQRPLKVLRKLTLANCTCFLEYLAVQPVLCFVSLVCCDMHIRRSSSTDGAAPVVNVDTLHLEIAEELPYVAVNLPDTYLYLTPSALIFPRVRRLALCGIVRNVSPGAEFEELRELHYSFASPVLAELVLSRLPLPQLEKLSLSYQMDDDTPLALEMLARCSRLAELELEGFSNLSVPRGLQLPTVRWLRLRGGTCGPSVVHWLMATLPGLRCLQLVNLTIDSHLWTPWFREWRRTGVEVQLEGGCTLLPWRRSSIRRYAPVL